MRALATSELRRPLLERVNGRRARSRRPMSRVQLSHQRGVDNQYDHPDEEALDLFRSFATQVFSTNAGRGQSLRIRVSGSAILTTLFEA